MSDTFSTGRSGASGSSMHEGKQQSSGMLDQATRQVREQAAGVMESAKDMASNVASQAQDKLREAVDSRKSTTADTVGSVANALRRTAGEFEREVPQLGPYIHRAAAQIDNIAEMLRRKDLNELVSSVQSFARRQPTAFLGATFLAGFALVRFLKSSSGQQSAQHFGGGQSYGGSYRGHEGHASEQAGGMRSQSFGAGSTGGYGSSRESSSNAGAGSSHSTGSLPPGGTGAGTYGTA